MVTTTYGSADKTHWFGRLLSHAMASGLGSPNGQPWTAVSLEPVIRQALQARGLSTWPGADQIKKNWCTGRNRPGSDDRCLALLVALGLGDRAATDDPAAAELSERDGRRRLRQRRWELCTVLDLPADDADADAAALDQQWPDWPFRRPPGAAANAAAAPAVAAAAATQAATAPSTPTAPPAPPTPPALAASTPPPRAHLDRLLAKQANHAGSGSLLEQFWHAWEHHALNGWPLPRLASLADVDALCADPAHTPAQIRLAFLSALKACRWQPAPGRPAAELDAARQLLRALADAVCNHWLNHRPEMQALRGTRVPVVPCDQPLAAAQVASAVLGSGLRLGRDGRPINVITDSALPDHRWQPTAATLAAELYCLLKAEAPVDLPPSQAARQAIHDRLPGGTAPPDEDIRLEHNKYAHQHGARVLLLKPHDDGAQCIDDTLAGQIDATLQLKAARHHRPPADSDWPRLQSGVSEFLHEVVAQLYPSPSDGAAAGQAAAHGAEPAPARSVSAPAARRGIFIAYTREDNGWRERLRDYLDGHDLRRQLQIWDDHCIEPGQQWNDAILSGIAGARAGVLLVSKWFLKSPFITLEELPRLLKASAEGLALLPVLLSRCTWDKTPELAPLECWNKARVIDRAGSTADQDDLLCELADHIMERWADPPADPAPPT